MSKKIAFISITLLILYLSGCSTTSSTSEIDLTDDTGTSSGLAVYKSTDDGVTWTNLGDVLITDMASLGAVDPGAIRVNADTIRLYYFGSFTTSGDPAASQPDNTWRFYVADSTDGINFTELGECISTTNSMTDPYVISLNDGSYRMYISRGSMVLSATADSGGETFQFESGYRSESGGVPGAFRSPTGSVYLTYGSASGISSKISDDEGYTFSSSSTTLIPVTGNVTSDSNPLKLDDNTYLMIFKITPSGGTSPVDDQAWLARSSDGITWDSYTYVADMSVPSIVEAANGDLYVYGTSF